MLNKVITGENSELTFLDFFNDLYDLESLANNIINDIERNAFNLKNLEKTVFFNSVNNLDNQTVSNRERILQKLFSNVVQGEQRSLQSRIEIFNFITKYGDVHYWYDVVKKCTERYRLDFNFTLPSKLIKAFYNQQANFDRKMFDERLLQSDAAIQIKTAIHIGNTFDKKYLSLIEEVLPLIKDENVIAELEVARYKIKEINPFEKLEKGSEEEKIRACRFIGNSLDKEHLPFLRAALCREQDDVVKAEIESALNKLEVAHLYKKLLQKFVVFDFGTTGLENGNITNIAALKFSFNGGRVEKFVVKEVNSLTLARFAAFIEGAVLVGHNIEMHDLPLLYKALKEYSLPLPKNLYFDTYIASKKIVQTKNHTVAGLAKKMNIAADEEWFHVSSYYDALITKEIFMQLLSFEDAEPLDVYGKYVKGSENIQFEESHFLNFDERIAVDEGEDDDWEEITEINDPRINWKHLEVLGITQLIKNDENGKLYLQHPYLRSEALTYRYYQIEAAARFFNENRKSDSEPIGFNTILHFYTGLGKTATTLLIFLRLLQKYKENGQLPVNKPLAVLLAPTRQLNRQHYGLSLKNGFEKEIKATQDMEYAAAQEIVNISTSFKKCCVPEISDKVGLLYGQTPENEREKVWKQSLIIIATPQLLESIMRKNESSWFNINDVAIVAFDEAHMYRKNHAGANIARAYKGYSLAISATLGFTFEQLKQSAYDLFRVRRASNFIDKSPDSPDVRMYFPKKKVKLVKTELSTDEYVESRITLLIQDYIKKIYDFYQDSQEIRTSINELELLLNENIESYSIQKLKDIQNILHSKIESLKKEKKYLAELKDWESFAFVKERLARTWLAHNNWEALMSAMYLRRVMHTDGFYEVWKFLEEKYLGREKNEILFSIVNSYKNSSSLFSPFYFMPELKKKWYPQKKRNKFDKHNYLKKNLLLAAPLFNEIYEYLSKKYSEKIIYYCEQKQLWPYLYFQKGMAVAGQGDYKEAIRCLNTAQLTTDIGLLEKICFALITCYVKTNNYTKVIELLHILRKKVDQGVSFQQAKEYHSKFLEVLAAFGGTAPRKKEELQGLMADTFNTIMKDIKSTAASNEAEVAGKNSFGLLSRQDQAIFIKQLSAQLQARMEALAEEPSYDAFIGLLCEAELGAEEMISCLAFYVNKLAALGKNSAIIDLMDNLIEKKSVELKMLYVNDKARELVNIITKNGRQKGMIFVGQKSTVKKIVTIIQRLQLPGIEARGFTGLSGQSYKKNDEAMDDFRKGKFNIIVSTSVGEVGLDVSDLDYIVEWDSITDVLREIQRHGRLRKKGSIYKLLALGTADQQNYIVCQQRKKNMKKAIKSFLFYLEAMERKETTFDVPA